MQLSRSLFISIFISIGTLSGTVTAATGELSAVEGETTGDVTTSLGGDEDSANSINMYSEGSIQWGRALQGWYLRRLQPRSQ